ncbi:MAG: ABC transporter ATP-binding protein [Acidilobaceae archaeon]
MTSLRLDNVSVLFEGNKAVDSVNVEFESGVHVVLGKNGAGKSTLLRAIAKLVDFQGEIYVDGRSIRSMSRKELAKTIGYCWQNPYYGFIEQTVEEEIQFILKSLGIQGDNRVVEILVPKELMKRNPFTLSGGEAKRVSTASILIANQPIWLLDEPFSFLDRDGVFSMIELVDYGRKKGKIIIVALHDATHSHLLKPDTYVLLHKGKLVARGSWDSLRDEQLALAGLLTRGELCGR